jgi:hypothetical protein
MPTQLTDSLFYSTSESQHAEDQVGEGCNVHGNMIVKKVPPYHIANFLIVDEYIYIICYLYEKKYHNFSPTLFIKLIFQVPGNFHVSAHAHANLIPLFFPNMAMNVTHFVHDLSFGGKKERDRAFHYRAFHLTGVWCMDNLKQHSFLIT